MTFYVGNAFSLSMLDRTGTIPTPEPITVEEAKQAVKDHPFVSVVGHPDTANLFTEILGVEIAPNRVSIKLTDGDTLLVGQYVDPRLPVGATALPEGATFEWWLI